MSPDINESDLDLSSDPDEARLTRHNQVLLNGQQQPPSEFWSGPGSAPPMHFDGGFPSGRGGGRFNGVRGRPHLIRGRGMGRGTGVWNPAGFEEPEGDPMDGFIDCPPHMQSPPPGRRRGRGMDEFPRRGRSMERRMYEERRRSPLMDRPPARYYPSRGRGRSRFEGEEFDDRMLDPRIMRRRSRSMERFDELEHRARREGRVREIRGRSRERSFEGEREMNYRRHSPDRAEFVDPRSEYEEGRPGVRVVRDPREEDVRRIRPLMEVEDLGGRLYSDRMETSVHARVSRPGRGRGRPIHGFEGEPDRSRSRHSVERERSVDRPMSMVGRAQNGDPGRRRSRERALRVSPSQTPPEVLARRRNRESASPWAARRARGSVSPRESLRKRESRSPRNVRRSKRSASRTESRRRKGSSSRDSRKRSESASPKKKPRRKDRSESPKKSKKRGASGSPRRSKKERSPSPKLSKKGKRSKSKEPKKEKPSDRAESRGKQHKSSHLNTSVESREDDSKSRKKKSTRGPVLRDKRPASDDSDDSSKKIAKSSSAKKVVASVSVEGRGKIREKSSNRKETVNEKKRRHEESLSPKKRFRSSSRDHSPVKRSLSRSSRSRSRSVTRKKKNVDKKRQRAVDISAMYDEQENDSEGSTPNVDRSDRDSEDSISGSEGDDSSPKRKKHKKHSKKVKKDKKTKRKKTKKSRK